MYNKISNITVALGRHFGMLMAFSIFAEATDIYISPNGLDTAAGTEESPVATLGQAQKLAREAKLVHSSEKITVWIGGGQYYLENPLTLSKEDSGTPDAPICYRAKEGETVEISNARPLGASDFQAITDSKTLARISPSAQGKIVVLDLKAFTSKNSIPPPPMFTGTGGMPDLFLNGQRMPLSRYPKEGGMTIKSVLVNGSDRGPSGVFEYREQDYPKFSNWQNLVDRGVWLKGYWRVMWQNEAIQVKSIDSNAHTVTFSQGIPGGIGNKYHRPKGDGHESYWLFNLLEEITQPGEWCLDYLDQKLYFYPPQPLDKSTIYLGDSEAPLLQMTEASNIIVRGLTFQYTLGDAILIKGGTNNLIAGCTVRNVDKYAIRIEGGTHHTVLSCDLYHLGSGGVWLAGGDDTSTPRKPAGHLVANNHIHHFSEIEKVYTPAVNCGYAGGKDHYACVGMMVTHNLVHDTPHGGILFGSWDNFIEYNEVFRYCLTSNDLGAFYCFSRYDFMGNNTLCYNLMHSSAQGDGIYFDWDHRDMHVYGNIVYLRSGGSKGCSILYKVGTQTDAKFVGDPNNAQKLDCHDNIAIQCRLGYSFFLPSSVHSIVENNVAINCLAPWTCTAITNGKTTDAPAQCISDSNKSYPADPGFVDLAHLNFHIRPDSQLAKDVPGLQSLPVDKIGLFVDEYRKTLPTDAEIDRFSEHTSIGGIAYAVEDRK